MRKRHLLLTLLLAASLAVAGVAAAATPKPPEPSTTAAGGDIPDNQVFIGFHDAAAGWSMRYPEGWARNGVGASVTFRDKNNIVRVTVERGPLPGTVEVGRDLAGLRGVTVVTAPARTKVSGAPAVKAVYTTLGAPNPVTGKRITLAVDRYYLAHAGRRAIVDLGTPQGVDNVDAYRLMIESFRWR